ncbi:MAG: cytochrome c [Caulobacteraceae bacterium]
MPSTLRACFPLAIAALAAPATAASAQTAPAHFAPAQAEHGADLYRQRCAQCHGDNLNDGEFGPSLKGAFFKGQWGGKTVGELFTLLTTTMPPGQVGVMTPDDYADLMALLLKANAVAAEGAPLPADPKALAGLTIAK